MQPCQKLLSFDLTELVNRGFKTIEDLLRHADANTQAFRSFSTAFPMILEDLEIMRQMQVGRKKPRCKRSVSDIKVHMIQVKQGQEPTCSGKIPEGERKKRKAVFALLPAEEQNEPKKLSITAKSSRAEERAFKVIAKKHSLFPNLKETWTMLKEHFIPVVIQIIIEYAAQEKEKEKEEEKIFDESVPVIPIIRFSIKTSPPWKFKPDGSPYSTLCDLGYRHNLPLDLQVWVDSYILMRGYHWTAFENTLAISRCWQLPLDVLKEKKLLLSVYENNDLSFCCEIPCEIEKEIEEEVRERESDTLCALEDLEIFASGLF